MKSNDRIPAAEWRIAQKLAAQARKNAKFAALAPEKKRVAIAEDVLRWLDTGKLTAVAQRYLVAPDAVEDIVNGYKCDACALGSLFACAVEHGEAGGTLRYSAGQRVLYGHTPSFGTVNVADTFDGKQLYEKLKGIFETEQLVAIETAFEGKHMLPSASFKLAGATRAEDYSWENIPQYLEDAGAWYIRNKGKDEQRMRAIMSNIIRNHGTFVPTQD